MKATVMNQATPSAGRELGPDGTVVIIGAGQSGGWAARTLRAEGFQGKIVLVGDEPHLPYERPPLSKSVLSGDADASSTLLMKQEAFDALNLQWLANTRVQRLDREVRAVELADGRRVFYDKLILCSGGRARPLPGVDMRLPHVHTLRTLADAQQLMPRLRAGQSLIVVGGGWIGLEVAATARQCHMEVVVLERQSRLCERTVSAEVSEHLMRLHESHGVRVLLGAELEALERGENGMLHVRLSGGDVMFADTVFVGAGLIPNDELARAAGLVCDGGVVVDQSCRSSDPDIFAAGDVAVSPNRWAAGHLRLESWQNAQEQGIAAARAVLGQAVAYTPLPWFWSDQYAMNLQIYGLPRSTHRIIRRNGSAPGSFSFFYLQGDVIQAAAGVNAAKELRLAKRLIELHSPVDVERLADPAIPMNKQ